MRVALIAVAAVCALAACGPTATTTTSSTDTSATMPANEITVTGVVSKVEDGGYPQFTVTMRPQGAADDLVLYLNAEAADDGGANADDFQGKTVALRYIASEQNDLAGMTVNGRQILQNGQSDEIDSVTGTLSGAGEASHGDLPDVVTVTDAQGHAISFEFFITPEMVAANGHQVTAFFGTSTRNNISYIRAN